jgi:hypothetical protein
MIVMELMPLGELKDYVMLHKDHLKGSTLAMQYCLQVARACEYVTHHLLTSVSSIVTLLNLHMLFYMRTLVKAK